MSGKGGRVGRGRGIRRGWVVGGGGEKVAVGGEMRVGNCVWSLEGNGIWRDA